MSITIKKLIVVFDSLKAATAALQLAGKIGNYFDSDCEVIQYSASKEDVNKYFTKAPKHQLMDKFSPKELAKYAAGCEADLVIVPVRQNPSDNGFINPTEACKLIDMYERLALTVPSSLAAVDVAHIVVPIDSSFETRQKTPYGVAFANAFKADLNIVGVSADKGKDAFALIQNYTRQVNNNVLDKGVDATIEMRIGGNPTNQAIDYAKEKKAGMLIIMTEQETNLASFFSGKYSEQMIKNCPVPVLSIHPKDLIVSDARL